MTLIHLNKRLNNRRKPPRLTQRSDRAYHNALRLINTLCALPMVRVNREAFLSQQFKHHPQRAAIVANGPQTVLSVAELRQEAQRLIDQSTRHTAMVSFAAGLPSVPIVSALTIGGVDAAQYFAFALKLAQQLAFLFGERAFFDKEQRHVPETVTVRLLAYLGAMFGASGASLLINKTAARASQHLARHATGRTLTSSATWGPLVRFVGRAIGKKLTHRSVHQVATKAIPLIGGILSGSLTYWTFKPLGQRLADTLAEQLTHPEEIEQPVLQQNHLNILRQAHEQDACYRPLAAESSSALHDAPTP